MSEVLFERIGPLGRVTLNRPKALNALTLAMVDALDAQLGAWAEDPAVAAVVITGAGERAFCAGGDIRALYDSGQAGTPYALDFYAREYRLNTRIKRYPKPYVALLNGIVMGGGVGVSLHGRLRVACEASLFAMPETGIGLFPDVGGSYALPRLPGETGLYLALTGARLGPADMVALGLAQAFVPHADWPAFAAAMAAEPAAPEAVAARFAQDPGDPPLAAHRATIDRCFAGGAVEEILAALDADGSAFAVEAAATIRTKSPTSLKVTLRQMREGRTRDFEDCMRMEFRLTSRFVAGYDFYEGVRAVIIDKDQRPRWRPDLLAAVSEADIAAYFADLGHRELVLP